MSKTIVQDVLFKNTTPKDLYDIYMDAGKHSVATGAPAEITATEGSSYSAHSGYITGKNLQLIPNRLIVQTWRAQSWSGDDIDSTFIISLEQQGNDVMLHAIHANVPNDAYDDLDSGWKKMYWEPWKLYLAGTPIAKAAM
ncbi:activator of Hsp90 ATPase-like protein [Chitinophaga niastensis]|uniref:Activator of Hsp90 ATPase-like protein n=1 Tax=Chitinophaga niastensis TaxID=536980 RepID=A0A2P8HJW7_CHINA|nr:SRPBCC domain-containing protein [Chitinophaga niastensis]PSL46513.1 activator of Hsp90 ATPase-like protein [Chitinophaga niastensis]